MQLCSLFHASTSWLESVCFIILPKEIINAKNCIKMKNVNVQLSFLIRDI